MGTATVVIGRTGIIRSIDGPLLRVKRTVKIAVRDRPS
jgi:hypothetical protein